MYCQIGQPKPAREARLRAVIQRVSQASVQIEGKLVSKIGSGYLVLLGVATGDTLDDAEYIVGKITHMRLFGERFDDSILETSKELLLVSQFTLLADCSRGRHPDWGGAAGGDLAREMYGFVGDKLRLAGIAVFEGRFGAEMSVSLSNEGPVTIILDSKTRKKS